MFHCPKPVFSTPAVLPNAVCGGRGKGRGYTEAVAVGCVDGLVYVLQSESGLLVSETTQGCLYTHKK